MKPALFLLLLALAGCETSATVAKCKGQAFGLNPVRWQPSTHDIKACSAPAPAPARRP